MRSFNTKLASAVLAAAVLGVTGGCQDNNGTVEPSQSTKQGSGQMKTPAGMQKPQPEGSASSSSAVTPSESAKQGTGQMKTPAGMEKPQVNTSAAAAASAAKPAAADLTHVLTKDSPYYTSSPAQSKPADGTLKSGTKLLLLMPSGSFAQVWTENGVKAYVPTDNIKSLK